MAERLNTIMCTFDPTSPRITTYDIHEWIQQVLRIPEHTVGVIQIDGANRQVFIKVTNNDTYKPYLGKQMDKLKTNITTEYYQQST